ncbi:hypothetical protein ACQPYA_16575 [Micromonospora sp. CA-263727]|uniref:hypothetical protein n=1 Tax=Micromonospora sp. CA-263727 TaxID=3239967 RepID=UPI003D8D2B5E
MTSCSEGDSATQRDPVRAPRRLPNDSIVVAFLAGAVLAARDRDAAAWLADVFLVAAFFVVALFAGAFVAAVFLAAAFFAGVFFAVAFLVTAAAFLTAGADFAPVVFFGAVVFFAAVAFAVGRRVGEAVAETAFFRAVRALVGAGFSPGVLAAVAPVARFAAVATFFAAALRGIGALPAPVCFLARPACAIVAPRDLPWRTVFPAPGRSNAPRPAGPGHATRVAKSEHVVDARAATLVEAAAGSGRSRQSASSRRGCPRRRSRPRRLDRVGPPVTVSLRWPRGDGDGPG